MLSAYCASKSGVEAFAHALRGEVAHHGVDVGVAYLSWTDTDMVRGGDEQLGTGAGCPGPLPTTYPLETTAAMLVAGIARRSAHVYAPWGRAVQVPRRTAHADETVPQPAAARGRGGWTTARPGQECSRTTGRAGASCRS